MDAAAAVVRPPEPPEAQGGTGLMLEDATAGHLAAAILGYLTLFSPRKMRVLVKYVTSYKEMTIRK